MSRDVAVSAPVVPDSMEGAPQAKLTLADALIWIFICASSAIIAVSLFTHLRHWVQGTRSLEELARWGDFWGGHLNSLTFALLASTLLLQRQQMKAQERFHKEEHDALLRELETQRLASIQQSLHFALEQLMECSERLAFRTVKIDWDGQKKIGDLTFGLFALGTAVQASMEGEDAPQICCDLRAVRDYHMLAQNALDTLAPLDQRIKNVCAPLLATLVPAWFIDYREKLEREEKETRRMVNQFLAGRTREWERHIEDGWRIEMCSVIMQRPYLVIARKTLHDLQRHHLDGEECQNEAFLLERALDYMN